MRPELRVAQAVFAITALLLLNGCGSGPNAATRLITQVTDGVEADIGDLRIVNVILVAQPDGSGVLVGTVVNNGSASDRIGAINANGVEATLTPFAPALNVGGKAVFSGDTANAIAVFPNLGAKIGDRVPVLFSFSASGKVKIDVLVREKSAEFANVNGSPISS